MSKDKNNKGKGKPEPPKEDPKCSGCGATNKWWNVIDNWCTTDQGGLHCRACQKKHKTGWYEKKP